MTNFFRIDVARTADVPDLADYCATHGLRAAAPAGLSCVEVGGDGVGIEQVIAAVEDWIEARGQPFVPVRVSERGIVLRPPTA
jgi:hypothetical protein